MNPTFSSRIGAVAAAGTLLLALAAAGAPAASAGPIRIVLSGDSIVESLPTASAPGTTLAERVQAALLAGPTARARGWVSGGSGLIPAHATCGGGRAGCLPSGLPLSTPWTRTGTWFDEGQLFTPAVGEGANGLPARSDQPGSWASTAVTADSISVLHSTQTQPGIIRVLVDTVTSTAARVTAGSTTLGPMSGTVGEFLPGQSVSGAGITPGSKVASTTTSGTVGGVQCPCVSLDRPATATSEAAQVTATGPSPRDLSFPVSGAVLGSGDPPARRDLTGLAWGRHSLAVGNAGGTIRFLGAVGERTSTRSPAITVSGVAHAGALAGDDLAPNQRAAMQLMRADLTVDMRGLNDELAEITLHRAPAVSRSAFRAALVTRFAIARTTGGCVHVPHAATLSVPLAVSAAYRTISRSTATTNRCSWSAALDPAWSRADSTKWTTDGKHPTPAGYARLASALANLIAARSELR